MSLLTIVQAASDELNLPRPSVVIGNNLTAVQKLLRFANRVGSDLALRGTWQALRGSASFAGVAGEEQPGVVPPDCLKIIPETFWDTGARKLVSGPVPGAEWQSLAATQTPGAFRWWTQRGNALLLFPALSGGETFRFEYRSRAFCQSAGGNPQTAWLADTDTGRISEELMTLGIVALANENEGGLAQAQMARAEFERRFAREAAADTPRDRILSAGDMFGGPRHWTGQPAADQAAYGWPYY